jgi:hypothetical protein
MKTYLKCPWLNFEGNINPRHTSLEHCCPNNLGAEETLPTLALFTKCTKKMKDITILLTTGCKKKQRKIR